MGLIYYLALFLFLSVSAVLCLVVLMQESKSSGLGASFGGDSGSSVFGVATADVLKKFTGWLAMIFFAGCIILSLWTAAIPRAQQARAPVTVEQSE